MAENSRTDKQINGQKTWETVYTLQCKTKRVTFEVKTVKKKRCAFVSGKYAVSYKISVQSYIVEK